ncbi:Protein of unknown function [Bacillus mycoides]|nr:Protein of unknown function [Bacillus mycoides]
MSTQKTVILSDYARLV